MVREKSLEEGDVDGAKWCAWERRVEFEMAFSSSAFDSDFGPFRFDGPPP